MSHDLPSKSLFDAVPDFNGDATLPFASESAAQRTAEEHAIDYALRNVPLPDGLSTRLKKLIYAIPDETADRMDWLGC